VVKTLITFAGRIPSKKNNTRRTRRGHRVFTMASEAYCDWEQDHVNQLRAAGIEALLPPYLICYNVYSPDKRCADLTNKIEGINDALVKSGIISDDNWFLLREVTARFVAVDRINPRIEVEITSKGN